MLTRVGEIVPGVVIRPFQASMTARGMMSTGTKVTLYVSSSSYCEKIHGNKFSKLNFSSACFFSIFCFMSDLVIIVALTKSLGQKKWS